MIRLTGKPAIACSERSVRQPLLCIDSFRSIGMEAYINFDGLPSTSEGRRLAKNMALQICFIDWVENRES